MTAHIMALTYAPKIPLVFEEKITQTIRAGHQHRIEAGDSILFHTWEGKPYRSPWGMRLEVVVTKVIPVEVHDTGILLGPDIMLAVTPWNELDWLAVMDGIVPSTGEELGIVLKRYMKKLPCNAQIIRWKPAPGGKGGDAPRLSRENGKIGQTGIRPVRADTRKSAAPPPHPGAGKDGE